MKKGSTAVLVITVMIFAVVLTLAALTVFMRTTGRIIVVPEETENQTDVTKTEADKFAEIDRVIQESFIKEYDRDKQLEDVYRSMLDSLGDQYSKYLNEEEVLELMDELNGSFTGAGIFFSINDEGEGFEVLEVIPDGPADVAGVKVNDIILKVDGKSFDEISEMTSAIKGEPGTEVVLTIMRDEEELELSIVRGDIKGSTVDSKTLEDENIGYIRIKTFGENTYSAFESALTDFEKAKVDGLIIDLRDNPGGIFQEGIKVADRLLPECILSQSKGKSEERETYNSDGKKTNLNLVVLVNENTASAAEMVAAAIKTNKAGTLVGTKTFGKGLMQEMRMYDDGSAIYLTTGEFFDSQGQPIEGVGVTPDTIVSTVATSKEDKQLNKAIELLKK